MKLYLECNMGAAGDMLMAALLELLPDRTLFLQRMRSLGLPGIEIDCDSMTKCGITGTKMRVRIGGVEEGSPDPKSSSGHLHQHEYIHIHEPSAEEHHDDEHTHSHYNYADICGMIEDLELAENVKKEALSVYRLLAEAESAVHGVPLEQIHFHEVGTLDAVVDIVGCSLLFQMLGVTQIEASSVHVGSGFVRCAHGVLPVPTPATAHILKGVPIYGGNIKGELCTPTGAALLKHFVRRFGEMEPIVVTKIGYGMGTKDFEAPN
ncbi:MAG: LarC family nickel insertion protein, partial [Clostridiales bacterium]|nr:LarC family nickel insertion protein [Clostridiales bacterium]